MARWRVTPKTGENTISTQIDGVDVDRGSFEGFKMEQDVSSHLEVAKIERENDRPGVNTGWKKAFTVPDIIAQEIKMNHHIDIFSQEFADDPTQKAKLFAIIESDYPLLKSTESSIVKRR